jgi:hypothetical protein
MATTDNLQNTGIYGLQGGNVVVVSAVGVINFETGSQIQVNGAQPGPTSALTDNTGGAVSNTLAAITAGAGYTQADMVAAKNALASLAAKVNALLTLMKNIGMST